MKNTSFPPCALKYWLKRERELLAEEAAKEGGDRARRSKKGLKRS